MTFFDLGDTSFQFLLDAVLKATALLAAAGLVALALRGSAARGRQLLWAVGLIGALMVPMLGPVLPAWNLPLFAWPQVADPAPAPASDPAAAQIGAAARSAEQPAHPAAEEASATLTTPGAHRSQADDPKQGAAPVAFNANVAATLAPNSASTPYWLALAWLAGSTLLLGRWALGQLGANRLARSAAGASGTDWAPLLERCRQRLGLRRTVTLLFHDAAQTPMTWGWLRPVILLPTAAGTWSEERREVVLLHELLHVRRNDWLLRSGAQWARAMYWFHPLAWLGLHRLTVEQETACDDGVLALGTTPTRYADHLLAIARAAVCPPQRSPIPLPAVEMAGRSPMEARLMSILSFSRRPHSRDPKSRRPLVPALVLAAVLVPALAAVQIWSAPTASADAAANDSATVREASAGLKAALAEMDAMEAKFRPFEERFEEIEREMEPIQEEMEGLERGHEPFEAEMKALEARFAPFEVQMAAIEQEMEPFEAQLEELEARMQPYVERIEAMELSSLPSQEQAEAFERAMAPLADKLSALAETMEPLGEEMERLHEQGEHDSPRQQELRRKMEEIHRQMESVHTEMEPVHREMERFHAEMEPFHQQMEAIHQEMEPLHELMEQVHEQMRPVHARIEAIHQEMEPIHGEMRQVHERMEPVHQEMERFHEQMEPFHQRMEEIHKEMQPIHEEMEQRHKELMRELSSTLRGILAEELQDLNVSGAALDRAAAEAAESVSIEMSEGRMSVRSSVPRLLRELTAALDLGQSEAARVAIESAARAISNLEVLY